MAGSRFVHRIGAKLAACTSDRDLATSAYSLGITTVTSQGHPTVFFLRRDSHVVADTVQ